MHRSGRSARRLALVGIVAAAGLWGSIPAQGVSLSVSKASKGAPEDWIVLFEDDVADVDGLARQEADRHGAALKDVYHGSVKGFTATFKDRKPGREATVWDHRVRWIERDQQYTFAATQSGVVSGIDRIDQLALPLSTTYGYTNTGAGVRAYVVDTGVMGTHTEFGSPSRVLPGYDATSGGGLLGLFGSSKPKPGNTDCHGHGTHVAGTIGGGTYGVAKQVTIVPVKVLSCLGSGSTSNIVKGIDWMIADLAASGKKAAVANMSLGGGKSVAMDDAVRAAITKGISFALAAGNSDADACGSSPSGVTEAMTVGAVDPLTDNRASFSNWGGCVDWFAPGVNITSAGVSSTTATAVMSGTSMAAPHTAGVIAQHLQSNPAATPAAVQGAVGTLATTGKVVDPKGSANRLLFTNL